jgi:hypothetical protein
MLAIATVVSERNQVLESQQLNQTPQVMVSEHGSNLSGTAH